MAARGMWYPGRWQPGRWAIRELRKPGQRIKQGHEVRNHSAYNRQLIQVFEVDGPTSFALQIQENVLKHRKML